MKWLLYVVLVVLVGGSWGVYIHAGVAVSARSEEVRKLHEVGYPEGKAGKLESELQEIVGQRTFTGVLLAFVSAGIFGIFFVLQILPVFAQRVTHAVYDSSEMIEHDVMHDARSLLAQGDYASAIVAFRQAAANDPMNRLPWVEIAKIHKDKLDDPVAAISTIREALESQEWELNDAAYFLFRLAELHDTVDGDRELAVAIMQQVIEQFPGTRHSANANHKLREWGIEPDPAAAEPEPLA